MPSTPMTPYQRLATSGARAVLPYTIGGISYLAVPQLAEDIPGQQAQMNLGNSNVETLLYRWQNGRFEEHARLPVPGGEDVEFFSIGDDRFLATASIRTGRGPYDINTDSRIFKWRDGAWEPFQSVPTFAAKQWRYFGFDGRHFLALAQGVTMDGVEARNPRHSCILEWDGHRFAPFQTLDGPWGYNWTFFTLGGVHYLAYADHVTPSRVHRWDGARFVPCQDFAPNGGRAFLYFEADSASWLAFADLGGDSTLYRWDGAKFQPHQTLGGKGGREFTLIRAAGALYLIRICFIEGTPAAPKVDLLSQLYLWGKGNFVKIQDFPTSGGTDAHAFDVDGQLFVAVSNSLSHDIRFREDSIIYRFAP